MISEWRAEEMDFRAKEVRLPWTGRRTPLSLTKAGSKSPEPVTVTLQVVGSCFFPVK